MLNHLPPEAAMFLGAWVGTALGLLIVCILAWWLGD